MRFRTSVMLLGWAFCVAGAGYGQEARLNEGTAAYSVRATVEMFIQARHVHDGKAAAATYAEDGQYISVGARTTTGRAALAALWGSMKAESKRTIEGVEIVSPSIGVVYVKADFQFAQPYSLNETYVVVREFNGEWKIRVHEATEQATARK